MIRVVADTNVLVSAVIKAGLPREFLSRCIEGKYILVLSDHILLEFHDVMARPKTTVDDRMLQKILQELVPIARHIEPRSKFQVVHSDPDDDKILATAVDGKADCIVSGDRHLLGLKEFQGIPILRVREFLSLHPAD